MARRIHWAKDGTIFYNMHTPNIISTVSSVFTDAVDDAKYSNGGLRMDTYLTNSRRYLVWEFPDFVNIGGFGISYNYFHSNSFNTWNFYTSVNSTNGIDGTWDSVGSFSGDATSGAQYYYTLTSVGPSRWLRAYLSGDYLGRGWNDSQMAYMHLFGDYVNEPYVLYDNETTAAPITDWDYFLSAPAPPDGIAWNTENFTLHKEFKIKNTSATNSNYTITCSSGISPYSDLLVNDYYRITSVSSPTPGTTFQTPTVAPDAFSEVINVDYSLDAINNPADGYHYFRVFIEETTP